MKAVILNDTSIEKHHGCNRVMDCIYQELNRHSVEIIAKSYLNADLESSWAREKLDSCDIAIINGEGTIHHGRPYAEDLLKLVAKSSAKRKVLLNCTYDSNPPRYRDYLEAFDSIFVRDQQSQVELSQLGLKSSIVPDMTFLAKRSLNAKPSHPVSVCCSVDREVLVQLHIAGTKLIREARPISIFEPARGTTQRIMEIRRSLAIRDLKTPIKMIRIARARHWFGSQTCATHEKFAEQIAQSKFLLSGRYHAICIAIKNGIPFLAIDSNTFKIRALLADVGLDERCISKSDFLAGMDLKLRPFSSGELKSIEKFNTRAERAICKMFAQITRNA